MNNVINIFIGAHDLNLFNFTEDIMKQLNYNAKFDNGNYHKHVVNNRHYLYYVIIDSFHYKVNFYFEKENNINKYKNLIISCKEISTNSFEFYYYGYDRFQNEKNDISFDDFRKILSNDKQTHPLDSIPAKPLKGDSTTERTYYLDRKKFIDINDETKFIKNHIITILSLYMFFNTKELIFEEKQIHGPKQGALANIYNNKYQDFNFIDATKFQNFIKDEMSKVFNEKYIKLNKKTSFNKRIAAAITFIAAIVTIIHFFT